MIFNIEECVGLCNLLRIIKPKFDKYTEFRNRVLSNGLNEIPPLIKYDIWFTITDVTSFKNLELLKVLEDDLKPLQEKYEWIRVASYCDPPEIIGGVNRTQIAITYLGLVNITKDLYENVVSFNNLKALYHNETNMINTMFDSLGLRTEYRRMLYDLVYSGKHHQIKILVNYFFNYIGFMETLHQCDEDTQKLLIEVVCQRDKVCSHFFNLLHNHLHR